MKFATIRKTINMIKAESENIFFLSTLTQDSWLTKVFVFGISKHSSLLLHTLTQGLVLYVGKIGGECARTPHNLNYMSCRWQMILIPLDLL